MLEDRLNETGEKPSPCTANHVIFGVVLQAFFGLWANIGKKRMKGCFCSWCGVRSLKWSARADHHRATISKTELWSSVLCHSHYLSLDHFTNYTFDLSMPQGVATHKIAALLLHDPMTRVAQAPAFPFDFINYVYSVWLSLIFVWLLMLSHERRRVIHSFN